MKFVKLRKNGREMLVNMSTVTEVYATSDGKCDLYLNLAVGDEQIHIKVEESIDEIYEKVKRSSD